MEQTIKYFTLETLGKLYTDAAKAGGLEYKTEFKTWEKTVQGPNLHSCADRYRLKPAPPIERWMLNRHKGDTYSWVFFASEAEAIAYQSECLWAEAEIIKLVQV